MPASPTTVLYDDLRQLVAANNASEASIKRAAATAAKAQSDAAQAKIEKDQLREENAKLKAELVANTERRQRDTLAAAAAAESRRQDTDMAIKRAVDDAIARESARSDSELRMLKQAAREDVRSAKEAGRSELEAACANFEEREAALREMMRLRSAKHAHRLREVIASEEACHADCARLEERLRESALATLALGVRLHRAERAAASGEVEVAALLREVDALEYELEDCDAARLAVEDASAEAAAMAEAEVTDLRDEVAAVASKQRQWKKALAARHEHDVRARADEEVQREMRLLRDEMRAEIEARDAAHRAEVKALAEALAASQARERQHQQEVKALHELLNG